MTQPSKARNKEKKTKLVGFWYSEEKAHFPKPEPNKLNQIDADALCALILEKQKKARVNRWKGYARSRITGERLGTVDFVLDGWKWPEQYAEHYIKAHRCCPPEEFISWLNYSLTSTK